MELDTLLRARVSQRLKTDVWRILQGRHITYSQWLRQTLDNLVREAMNEHVRSPRK